MNLPKRITVDNADEQVLTYLKILLTKKGMEILPPEILADMLIDLYSRFESFLFLSVMQNMDPEKYQALDDYLITAPSPEKSMEFLRNNVNNIDEVLQNAMVEFEKIYLES
jgi:hypothetical protein